MTRQYRVASPVRIRVFGSVGSFPLMNTWTRGIRSTAVILEPKFLFGLHESGRFMYSCSRRIVWRGCVVREGPDSGKPTSHVTTPRRLNHAGDRMNAPPRVGTSFSS